MVESGLKPTDPVRWYLAYAIEREQADDGQGQGDPDIEVLGEGSR
jgi:hypothetical protein